MRPHVLIRNLLFIIRRGGLRRALYAVKLWFREEAH
jgi:hypothetical protein